MATGIFEHVYIAEVTVGCIIGDYACQANLPASVIQSEAERVLDRPLVRLNGPALCPVRSVRQVVVNGCGVQLRPLGADRVLTTLVFSNGKHIEAHSASRILTEK